jgi:hypothetical protein
MITTLGWQLTVTTSTLSIYDKKEVCTGTSMKNGPNALEAMRDMLRYPSSQHSKGTWLQKRDYCD